MSAIYFSRYQLRASSRLNARTERLVYEGALLRRDGGFACLHPWPELGDLDVEGQFDCLRQGGRTALLDGALACLEWDMMAREQGRCIDPASVPRSHWLVRQGDKPEEVKSRGFDTVKIKGSPDGAATAALAAQWADAGFRLRLDFNESLGAGELARFWSELSDAVKQRVDCVEDPERWTEEGWQHLRAIGVPVAVDRDSGARWRAGDVRVVKPALAEQPREEGERFFVTTYMEHAIGQMYAVARAAEWNASAFKPNLLTCGLMSHYAFESDVFFERLGHDGSGRLTFPEELGLGFGDILERLPWKKLV